MVYRSMMFKGRGSAQAEKRLRARVSAAFRSIANGIDRRTAQVRTWDFFSSGAADWARRLK
jgi:hypothetical protein